MKRCAAARDVATGCWLWQWNRTLLMQTKETNSGQHEELGFVSTVDIHHHQPIAKIQFAQKCKLNTSFNTSNNTHP